MGTEYVDKNAQVQAFVMITLQFDLSCSVILVRGQSYQG